ncbi:16S rRNA methyltransferase [Rhodobacteraceae bacterium WD3A24]|nr:16S rRNA methyltransferase [Rhodobacteraceae bacterium WD3A24]
MARQTQSAGLPARRGALALLDGVLQRGQPLSELLVSGGPLDALEPADRARAQRLALATLRNIERADTVLAPHLRKAPPPAVRNILRLATVELSAEGAAAHGVVNAAVALVRAGRRTGHLAGLVNAVLRRVAEQPAEAWEALPPQRLPPWLRKRLVHAYGRPAVAAMEAAHLAGAAPDLTLRDGDADGWAARLEGARVLPTGSLRLPPRTRITALEGYDSGAWWVQDAAAAIAARLLAPQAGEAVLDLCAAPGGKALQLAAAGAAVTALDISGPRMERLRDNLSRTGLSAELVVADALHWTPPRRFDAILLDAPCTATGTIRRHPDLPFLRTEADIAALAELQAAMLDRALAMLAPGGRLVFCTCSLLPEEGEEQIVAALDRHPGLAVERDAPLPRGVEAGWRTLEGGLRLRPDYWPEFGGMDGFYIARLHRAGP